MKNGKSTIVFVLLLGAVGGIFGYRWYQEKGKDAAHSAVEQLP